MKDDEEIANKRNNYFSEIESKLAERVPTNVWSSADYIHSYKRPTPTDDKFLFYFSF